MVVEGPWDAVAASWDAFEHDEPARYAFCSISASTSADVVRETLKIHFPGVPVVILTDQDGAGKLARKKLAHLGTLGHAHAAGIRRSHEERAMNCSMSGPSARF